jgi:hypothetical protein
MNTKILIASSCSVKPPLMIGSPSSQESGIDHHFVAEAARFTERSFARLRHHQGCDQTDSAILTSGGKTAVEENGLGVSGSKSRVVLQRDSRGPQGTYPLLADCLSAALYFQSQQRPEKM